jgi:hypothetical protein
MPIQFIPYLRAPLFSVPGTLPEPPVNGQALLHSVQPSLAQIRTRRTSPTDKENFNCAAYDAVRDLLH